MNLSGANDIFVALFITHDVQDTCSFKGEVTQVPCPRPKDIFDLHSNAEAALEPMHSV